MTTLAVKELDRAYAHDAGVIRVQQLLPYGLVLRYSGLPSDDPADSAIRLRIEKRWRRAVQRVADEVAATSWRERAGPVVVVLAARSERPRAFIDALLAHPSGARVRAWPEGDRVAMVLVVAKGGSVDNADRLLARRAQSVRSSVVLQRATSLTTSAVVPPIVLAVMLFIALIVLVLVLAPIALVFRRPLVRRAMRRRADPTVEGSEIGLAPGVEVVQLPERRTSSGVGYMRVVPLAIVALPAGTSSLWPGSLIWAAIIALPIVLAMRWARGSRVARWTRRLVYVAIGLGLSHAVFGVPRRLPTTDRWLVGALGAAVILVAVLAIERRRRTQEPRVGVGLLGARWIVLLVGVVVLASSSVALFLGSNGEPVRANVLSKLTALPGLVVLTIAAQRLRAARSLAQRERMRRLHRPEVLYLRSFVDDGLKVRSKRRTRSGLERWLPWPTELFEDVLLRGFECVGPVVAIGRPGTSQTELGASRDLVIGEDWLTAVKAEMERAYFITVVLGPGKGLNTEMLTLRELGRLDRVCIVVPPTPADEVAQRLAAGTQALEGEKAWGDITAHAVDGQGEIVALVAIGGYRAVMVAKRRALASTYTSLADRVCAEIAARRDPHAASLGSDREA
jgi:hypothetical protein